MTNQKDNKQKLNKNNARFALTVQFIYAISMCACVIIGIGEIKSAVSRVYRLRCVDLKLEMARE